jgi:hypothetical protein
MPRRLSTRLRNGKVWRKSGQLILDEARAKSLENRLPVEKPATEWASERKQAADAIAELRAEVEAARARRARKPSA